MPESMSIERRRLMTFMVPICLDIPKRMKGAGKKAHRVVSGAKYLASSI
jgi:hypothetical protein